MKENLPVAVIEEPPAEVPVKIDPKTAKALQRAAEEKEIQAMRQQFNTRTMRVKTKLLADAGIDVKRWGVQEQGHGRLFYGGENADRIIAAIERDIQQLFSGQNFKAEVVAELRMIQWRFNKHIIEVGQSHLEAAKEVAGKSDTNMHIAFPVGKPVVVAVSSSPANVNDKEKTLTEGSGEP